jgi:hypothetical protein
MVALLPRLLLEIDRTIPTFRNECRVKQKIKETKILKLMNLDSTQ